MIMIATEAGNISIDPPQEPADIDANDDDNAAIIINPAGLEHVSPIVGVTTD